MSQNETRGAGDILAVGFGMAVAMWGVGYVGRLPVVMAPSALVGIALVVVPVIGGWVGGRYGTRGWKLGLHAGLVAGVLDLLVLGSFLSGDQPGAVRPAVLVFVPAFVLVMGVLGAIGGALGAAARRSVAEVGESPDWTAWFARVALAATFLLLVAGGIVTSSNSGLAVVDWPNSFGYNMFLYPISRMTGGVFYEHAHRLLGSLVGLTTLVLMVHLLVIERRRFVRNLAVLAFVLVCVQGILGGLRVTGTLTLSDDPGFTQPNIKLAVLHGIVGQIFFSILAVLAAATSVRWKRLGGPVVHRGGGTDRTLGLLAVGCLVVQLTLGAMQRHLASGLIVHLLLAFVVAGLTIASGLRLWGIHGERERVLARTGLALMTVTGLQLVLGLAAYAVTGALPSGSGWDIVVTTAHQGTGAALLALAVASSAWTHRLLAAEEVEVAARSERTA